MKLELKSNVAKVCGFGVVGTRCEHEVTSHELGCNLKDLSLPFSPLIFRALSPVITTEKYEQQPIARRTEIAQTKLLNYRTDFAKARNSIYEICGTEADHWREVSSDCRGFLLSVVIP